MDIDNCDFKILASSIESLWVNIKDTCDDLSS